MNEINKKDSITFSQHYEIIEEMDTADGVHTRLHNAAIKLNHQDILKFIKDNKLSAPDTLEHGVFTSSTFLLKEVPEFSKSFFRGINKTQLYADTTRDKLYISIFY